MVLPLRSAFILGLIAGIVASPALALDRNAGRNARSAEAWAGAVVSRITQADLKDASGARSGGSVTVRIRIAADGTLEGAAVEEGSGSTNLDERALKAVKAAAPFAPPPRSIVTLEGFTEISFPLQLDTATRQAP